MDVYSFFHHISIFQACYFIVCSNKTLGNPKVCIYIVYNIYVWKATDGLCIYWLWRNMFLLATNLAFTAFLWF